MGPTSPLVKPYFKHDCDRCVFIMQRDGLNADGIFPAGLSDVYVCEQGGMPTGIVRYGDHGWLYASADHFLPKIYEEVSWCPETRALAKAVARHGRHAGRKWRSDARRKRARQTRRDLKSGRAWKLIADFDPLTDLPTPTNDIPF